MHSYEMGYMSLTRLIFLIKKIVNFSLAFGCEV